jgi:taurine--2-oxoglutarate transaminase
MAKLASHLKSKHLYAFSRFNMLWVCPPLIISENELGHGLGIIEEALVLVDRALGKASPARTLEPVSQE